jgi:hypothetical protein
MSQTGKELAKLVPMTNNRKSQLDGKPFHNLEKVGEILSNWFDIDIFAGVSAKERGLASRLFHRRHVYEHSAGVVDQKYIDNSGDTSVVSGQHIRETKEDLHILLNMLVKVARNTHNKFHEIFPPIPEPIRFYKENQERIRKHG